LRGDGRYGSFFCTGRGTIGRTRYWSDEIPSCSAVRGGLKDAREGQPAYFWGLFTDPAERKAALKDGWKAVGKVFILAIVLDAIYQFIELRWFYPGEAVLVAIILAIIPYLLVRGPVNRIARRSRKVEKGRLAGD
jgi:hypothetical protein